MPLSEHEQRLLEQMERALYAEDPKFASALRGADLRTHYRRRAYQAMAGFVLGVALLMAGVIVSGYLWVSIVGFLVMLTCAVLTVSNWRRIPSPGETAQLGAATPRRHRQRVRLVDRLEERWRRRRDENEQP